MFVRALAILIIVIAASLLLTWHFGAEIVLALGVILTQAKLLWGKVLTFQLPSALTWFKSELATFFRIELIKKYVYSTFLPVLMGASLRRRIGLLMRRYMGAIKARFDALMAWYRALDWKIQVIATLIVISATLGLSVASIGLWLILFSVQLPFWLLAFLGATIRSVGQSMGKYAFKTVMFLQLGWLWQIMKRQLPPEYLERKRRFDFRLVRRVVRQRRMTLRQLEAGHKSLFLRLALLRAYIGARKPAPPTERERAHMRRVEKRGPR